MSGAMPEVTTDRGRAEDAAQVAALFAASREAAMPWLPVLHGAAEDRAFFAGVLAEQEVHVVRRGDEVLGFIAIDGGEVDHLYVRPDVQRRGLGSMLLAIAKARRPDGLELWAFQRNAAARGFYARHGFEEVRRTDGSGNEEREPDVRLAWRGAAPGRPGT
jgi:ribosomal protein S18 acetylase RimI-like enzyme